MSDTIGKLVIKTHIQTGAADQHGRAANKWVTLFTQHGLARDEADAAAAQFKENNPHLRHMTHAMYAEWIAYPAHVSM